MYNIRNNVNSAMTCQYINILYLVNSGGNIYGSQSNAVNSRLNLYSY